MTTIRDTFSRNDFATLQLAESGEAWEQTFALAPGVLGTLSGKAVVTTPGAALADLAVAGITLDSEAREVSVTIGVPNGLTGGALGVSVVLDPIVEGVIVVVARGNNPLDPLLVQVLEGDGVTGAIRAQAFTDGPYDEVDVVATLHDGQLTVTATGAVSLGPLGITVPANGYVGIGTAGDTFGDGVTFDDFLAVGLDIELEGDGPCQAWTSVADVQACEGCADLSDTAVASAIAVASQILYNLSGRRFPGICSDVVRPCSTGCGCRRDSCSCPGLSEITLGGWPIVAVSEVLVDGVALIAGTDYRVDNGTTLVRLDDEVWPCCQDMSLAATELDTWQVTYTYGRAIPSGGQLAAKLYACEIAKLCAGGDCRLPAKVQSVSRQGVTAGFIDFGAVAELGGIGIPIADQWLASLDHAKQGRGLIIASPDSHRSLRRTGA
jgi:hypothetical protein